MGQTFTFNSFELHHLNTLVQHNNSYIKINLK